MPLGAEALKFLIFAGRHEIAGDLSVAGHRDGTPLGQHAVAAEIAGEFSCGHCLSFCHVIPSINLFIAYTQVARKRQNS